MGPLANSSRSSPDRALPIGARSGDHFRRGRLSPARDCRRIVAYDGAATSTGWNCPYVRTEGERPLSEYQYYEFQAIDRPLSETDRQALRELSTRARITATSFTNEYHWGDFKGSPLRLMERWFDLHLYLANWGTRRLMIRLPQRLVARSHLDRFLRGVDLVRVRESGENLIVDVFTVTTTLPTTRTTPTRRTTPTVLPPSPRCARRCWRATGGCSTCCG